MSISGHTHTHSFTGNKRACEQKYSDRLHRRWPSIFRIKVQHSHARKNEECAARDVKNSNSKKKNPPRYWTTCSWPSTVRRLFLNCSHRYIVECLLLYAACIRAYVVRLCLLASFAEKKNKTKLNSMHRRTPIIKLAWSGTLQRFHEMHVLHCDVLLMTLTSWYRNSKWIQLGLFLFWTKKIAGRATCLDQKLY